MASAFPVPFCILTVKAVPNAPRSAIIGRLGGAIKIKVHAPALESRANDALCAFLAETLLLPRRAVSIRTGDTSRHKLVRIEGLTLEETESRLNLPAH